SVRSRLRLAAGPLRHQHRVRRRSLHRSALQRRGCAGGGARWSLSISILRSWTQGTLADDGKAVAIQPHDGMAGVVQQHHAAHAQVEQDLGAFAVVAERYFGRVTAFGARGQVIGKRRWRGIPDQADDALTLRGDFLHSSLQFAPAAEGFIPEDIVQDRKGVDPNRHCAFRINGALPKGDVLRTIHDVAIDRQLEVTAVATFEGLLQHTLHDLVVAAPIGDQVGDGGDLQTVPLGEGDEVIPPGHGAIVVHDLADHAGWIKAGKTCDIDRRFSMADPHQHTPVARHQRKNVPGSDNVVRSLAWVDCDRHGARAIGRRYPRGYALARLYGNGKGGFVAGFILPRHHRQAQLLDPLARHGEADEAATVLGHEVDCFGPGHLVGYDQIAFILPIFIVYPDEHAAIACFFYGLFHRRDQLAEGDAPGFLLHLRHGL